MLIQTLTLTQTRCLTRYSVTLPEDTGLVVLTGPNGSGKTTVLEGISLLFGGRGILGSDMADIGHNGSKTWGVYAEFADGQTTAVGNTAGKKMVKINGVAATPEDLATRGSIVALVPRQDRLFHESPSQRRAWLDDLTTALTPTHTTAVSRYRTHLQNRLKLLREGRSGDWLDAEEWQAATWGIQVLTNRQTYLSALKTHLPATLLALKGNALAVLDSPDPTTTLQGKFARSREIDTRLERTHAGPNTLDVEGTLLKAEGQTIPLHQSSSGQHKKAMVNILLGHTELIRQKTGQSPIVLIDELTAHLDATRRTEVLEHLHALQAQVWATDTDHPHLPHAHILSFDPLST